MGLDMYLYKREYISIDGAFGGDRQAEQRKLFADISEYFGGVSNFAVPHAYIDINVAYWRKANAIHGWFMSNLAPDQPDECQRLIATVEQLIQLRDLCTQVLADHSLAQEELPTTSGFFFGSGEYNDGYFDDLMQTHDQLDDIIKDALDQDYPPTFIYQASW